MNFISYATNIPVLHNNEKVTQGSHCGDPGPHPVGEIQCTSCYDVAGADSLLVTDLIVCNCSTQLIVQCNRQYDRVEVQRCHGKVKICVRVGSFD